MIQLIKRHTYLFSALLCSLVLIIFLGSTNPEQVNVGLLIIPVVLVFLITFCIAHILINVLKIMKKQPRRRRAVALVAAMILTVIAILGSTGGVSGADVLLLGLIILISGIYISKF